MSTRASKSSDFPPLPVLPPRLGGQFLPGSRFQKGGKPSVAACFFCSTGVVMPLYRTERSLYRCFGTNWFAPKKISGRGESAFGAGGRRNGVRNKFSFRETVGRYRQIFFWPSSALTPFPPLFFFLVLKRTCHIGRERVSTRFRLYIPGAKNHCLFCDDERNVA